YFYGTPWERASFKNNINEYLVKKYDKEFEIDEISFDLFHDKTYHAYAFPKDNVDLTFYVGQNPATKEIEDRYLTEIWQMQAEEELKLIMKEYFLDHFNYAVTV